jgi:hypothetical protein
MKSFVPLVKVNKFTRKYRHLLPKSQGDHPYPSAAQPVPHLVPVGVYEGCNQLKAGSQPLVGSIQN